MMQVRRGNERGHAQHGWLESYHTFSFADYYDARFMGFRTLRVINEDRVQAGRGFDTHSHRDMEIISYVLEGALEHEDSTGTKSIIRPGEVQRMSAGSGVAHSEYNHSSSEIVHFLQIWIFPEREGLTPSYEQKSFAETLPANQFALVASRDGRDGSVRIHQDVNLYLARLADGASAAHSLSPQRFGWMQVARGGVALGGESLQAGDGVALADEPQIELTARGAAELLFFDLA